ncbi:MAG: bifunctional oligoribonuclease/PAP phosphatase NrnA [Candidatus Omnitrophica bacterium]|nr:bifunctional oligoribonuclease/PAP phosphatase NrnA [Candidatus Omnitrophota bacterium]
MSMKRIIQIIKKNKKFLISTHVNPDPDALCSELALAIYLKSLGKTVTIVNHEPVHSRFHFLPRARSIKSYDQNKRVVYDVAVIVDCGELSRIGKVQNLIQKEKILINIDHHITNDRFGDINLVMPMASSAAEVLYELLRRAKCTLTKNLAMHLYVGIMTDTGSFRYENTTARTHEIVAELLRHRISAVDVYRKLYEIIPFSDLKEFMKVISGFDMFYSGKVVCVQLRKKALSKFSGEFDLRDTIFKFLRSIKSVEVFVVLTEIDKNRTRVNMRSTNSFDVAKLANRFKGGGHRRASGCMINKNILSAQKDVLREIKKIL